MITSSCSRGGVSSSPSGMVSSGGGVVCGRILAFAMALARAGLGNRRPYGSRLFPLQHSLVLQLNLICVRAVARSIGLLSVCNRDLVVDSQG